MVTSKPKRISVAVGLVHMIRLLIKLTNNPEADILEITVPYNLRVALAINVLLKPS
jgi:hypothetical protein